jgi:DNA mismatch repair protein MutS2
MALELERAKEARRKDLGRESDALRLEVREARATLRSVRQALKSADVAQLSQLERSLDDAAKVVALGGKVDRDLRAPTAGERSGLDEKDVRVGMRVKIAGFGEAGEVLMEPRRGQVQVLVGVMKMSVPLTSLERTPGSEKNARRSPAKTSKSPRGELHAVAVPVAPVRSQDVTLDLRGKRVEQGLLDVDHFVDELLRRQEPGGFVLHGHGTGAMKEAVRTHLRAHACIVDSRPAERDEGGDAFTVFWLG